MFTEATQQCPVCEVTPPHTYPTAELLGGLVGRDGLGAATVPKTVCAADTWTSADAYTMWVADYVVLGAYCVIATSLIVFWSAFVFLNGLESLRMSRPTRQAFSLLVAMFALFILLCGIDHWWNAHTVYRPAAYAAQTWLSKVPLAIVSGITAAVTPVVLFFVSREILTAYRVYAHIRDFTPEILESVQSAVTQAAAVQQTKAKLDAARLSLARLAETLPTEPPHDDTE